MSCNICVEKYNKSTHLEIKCNFCEFSNCRACFQKYLLETTDTYCMNCKKIFTRDFITDNCTQVFFTKEFKKHRENVLLDREKSLMSATQVYVVLEKNKNNLREQIKEIEKEREKMILTINVFQNKINILNSEIYTMTVNNVEGGPVQERKKFIRKCPMQDCRGFLSQQWKCGICDSKICNKCNEQKENDEHVCIPENVASMELLNKDTKPCPECGTMIFRISGCPQIFCIECHCAWNWNTGLVEKGVIHNPHYYEFLKKGGNLGRNHGDIPCGGLPDMYSMRNDLSNCVKNYFITKDQETIIYNFHNCITHIQQYEIHIINEQNEETTRSLRVRYMLHKISEEDFKKNLQQIEKEYNKKRDFNNIYQMFVDVSSDIFRQIIVFIQSNKRTYAIIVKKFMDKNLQILLNLKNYFNENIKKLGNNYKCVYPGIDDRCHFQNNYKTYLARTH